MNRLEKIRAQREFRLASKKLLGLGHKLSAYSDLHKGIICGRCGLVFVMKEVMNPWRFGETRECCSGWGKKE